jgi:restriction system protein
MQVPAFDQLMLPLFNALKDLGGSGSIAEIDEKVGEDLDLSTDVLDLPHNPEGNSSHQRNPQLSCHISMQTVPRICFGIACS